jgi:hypothetical protein
MVDRCRFSRITGTAASTVGRMAEEPRRAVRLSTRRSVAGLPDLLLPAESMNRGGLDRPDSFHTYESQYSCRIEARFGSRQWS